MMTQASNILIVMIALLVDLHYSESFSFLSNEVTPAEWAVQWNGIGRSNNPADDYAYSWKGTGISQEEKEQLISKIESQPASEVYAALLARPGSKVSYYGTCMVGIVKGIPRFSVEGMYGSLGHSGYPKNPVSRDGTGHLQGCHNEHRITGLCSYSDVAERAKRTLLYAVKNDVCTNYYNLKQQIEPVSQVKPSLQVNGTDNIQARVTKFLAQVGLTIPPAGTGDKWITLCEVRARIRYSSLGEKSDTQTCTKTAKGEIKETRVRVKAEWNCKYRTESYASGTMLHYKNQIDNQYNNAIKLAIEGRDKAAADYMETMKYQHMENLQVATNHDTTKLTATATSAPFWGPGANCDLVLEGRVNELF